VKEKMDSIIRETREGLIKAGFSVDQTSRYQRETEVTDPATGKHFATIRFGQKFNIDPINIRVNHAGMRHHNEYSHEAKSHRQEPYSEWYWAGRNYKIPASAVNAVVKFVSGIPSDMQADVAKLEARQSTAWARKRDAQRCFQRSFGVDELAYLLGLVPDGVDFTVQRRHLSSMIERTKEAKKAEAAVDKAEALMEAA